MIFDWADGGNLCDFWKTYPDLGTLPRGQPLAIWVTQQILGFGEGLRSIHNCEIDEVTVPDASSNSVSKHKIHGAHCDLKPENILWFRHHGAPIDDLALGHTKLSDFGLTTFHATETRGAFTSYGVSQTYRAPEWDINNHIIGQQYDHWTLGCVILEFITWYMLGWEGCLAFEQERTHPYMGVYYPEDSFFNVTKFDLIASNMPIATCAKRSKGVTDVSITNGRAIKNSCETVR